MGQYLSKKTKRKLSFGYIFFFLFIAWYVQDTNKVLQDSITKSQINFAVSDYRFYNKFYIKSNKNKQDVMIKNHNYINNEELIEEYSSSTPFMVDKKLKQIPKYNTTIKFFDKNKRHSIDIENKISLLKDENYIYNFKDNYIELFGKVTDDGYVRIIKQLEKSSDVKSILNNNVLKILLIGFINIGIFLYMLTLFDEHEKNKIQMYNEYDQLSKDAQAVAMVDTLTGAATRIKFNQDLNDLIQLASRFKEQTFTFMILDIDNFKNVNDSYGHDYGDIVLKDVATTVKKHIRKTDYFYRWGGEEFVILMPMNDLKKSIEYAEIVRESISKIAFKKIKQITCSFGLVEFELNDNETTIIKRADELLYKAKKNGKNRVEY